jgi:microcystin-dependent protein
MSEPFLGQIMQVGFNFAPSGWSTCAGQSLPVQQNAALFALLGTNFGGTGTTNFQLPDLQSRVAIGTGQGTGLSPYLLGDKKGVETTVITAQQLPMHTHNATFTPTGLNATLQAIPTPSGTTTDTPAAGSILSTVSDSAAGGAPQLYTPAGDTGTPVNLGGLSVTATGGGVTIAPAGASLPVSLIQPYLAVTTIIALQGIFPSRG